MQAEDVTSLTQQLQLLHVTKEFQQQVKASSTAGNSSSSGGSAGSTGARVAGAAAAMETPAPRGAAAAAGSSAAANKEVASLENLLKVHWRWGWGVAADLGMRGRVPVFKFAGSPVRVAPGAHRVCHVQVRETLHANAVGQKRRQMRSLEAQLAAKRNENATLALHLAGRCA